MLLTFKVADLDIGDNAAVLCLLSSASVSFSPRVPPSPSYEEHHVDVENSNVCCDSLHHDSEDENEDGDDDITCRNYISFRGFILRGRRCAATPKPEKATEGEGWNQGIGGNNVCIYVNICHP